MPLEPQLTCHVKLYNIASKEDKLLVINTRQIVSHQPVRFLSTELNLSSILRSVQEGQRQDLGPQGTVSQEARPGSERNSEQKMYSTTTKYLISKQDLGPKGTVS